MFCNDVIYLFYFAYDVSVVYDDFMILICTYPITEAKNLLMAIFRGSKIVSLFIELGCEYGKCWNFCF